MLNARRVYRPHNKTRQILTGWLHVSRTIGASADMPERVDKSDQQKDAESKVKSFQANLGPFVVATETTRMAMVFTDATERGNPIIFANDSFLSLDRVRAGRGARPRVQFHVGACGRC